MENSTGFGTKVFSKNVMRERLSAEICAAFEECTHTGGRVKPEIAQGVADAMKEWAIELGATHFTHWFQPMTGITAGKFDAFVVPDGEGSSFTEFSQNSLFKGEPDASSFPSGGLRATFEARGYTAWDPTSPAFVKGDTLYIPTAFCSYTGEALDAKTPLLRSMEAVSREATRLCHAMGLTDVTRVDPAAGAEQEYFLVDRERYEQRLDLKICGTTLLGAKPPKGQELDDHYLGRIRLRIDAFMREVDKRLWELGVPSKTKHNEAAPAQHELAPLYAGCNVACDHNQLIMETMRIVAKEQGLACLLHEKPFAGINGSGKHNNYSLCTDTGINLFRQGKHPEKNPVFIISLCAFIRAVDSYPQLLRLSTAGAGNDRRLGAGEAPPAVVSMFLGDHLLEVLTTAAKGCVPDGDGRPLLNIGVSTSPQFAKDDCDRNRTSPLAFTGNKFEFRMVGSSQSIAMANTVLNTIMADSFSAFANYFEQSGFTPDTIAQVVAETLLRHGRVIFNGNNYDKAWLEEAARRGLPIIEDSVEAFDALRQENCVNLFERFGVLSRSECLSRYEITLESYNKVVSIEAATIIEMVRRQLLPATAEYTGLVARSAKNFTIAAGTPQQYLQQHLEELSLVLNDISTGLTALEQATAAQPSGGIERARYIRDVVRPAMDKLRVSCDHAETIVDCQYWPIPTYTDLLHRV
ncbi:MAG: glutamine synthetase III [Angelakisella sp.]